jgi:YVTN family beta-propeller protein
MLASPVIFKIMVLAALFTLSNNAFAQELPPPDLNDQQTLHERRLSEVVKQTSGLNQYSQIDVGDLPLDIGILEGRGTSYIYVANSGSNTVSVIDAENNEKITEDIRVENRPADIGIHVLRNAIYVANYDSNTVSVISEGTNRNMENVHSIPVGERPAAIGISPALDRVYVANSGSNTVSVIDAENNENIGDILVGESPADIRISEGTSTVYVTNHDSNTVSVINATTNTKITEDIPVGERPAAIGILEGRGTSYIYVANSGSNTVSVIAKMPNNTMGVEKNVTVGETPWSIGSDSERGTVYVANVGSNTVSVIAKMPNNTMGVEKNVTVGETPWSIGSDSERGTVYVANVGSNTVSVINATTNTKITEDIPVGERPAAIAVSEGTDTVYVANYRSSGISAIDAVDNEIVAGIKFQENPLDSGYIECDGLAFPSSQQQYYVPSGTECIARPNPGFEFVSWEEILEDGSTQLIRVSRPASAFESFLDLLSIRSDEPEAKLNITKFGTFTANFKELPPAVPSEYWIPLYGIIATTIVGWSIPGIIGWIKSKMDVRKLNFYHKQITSLYRDGKLDENDIEPLDKLRQSIVNGYSTGNLNEKHYENLKDETSILYDKIFRKRLDDALNNNNPTGEKATQEQLAQIRNDVAYAYSEGKINEKHYVLLTKAIPNLNGKNDDIP